MGNEEIDIKIKVWIDTIPSEDLPKAIELVRERVRAINKEITLMVDKGELDSKRLKGFEEREMYELRKLELLIEASKSNGVI